MSAYPVLSVSSARHVSQEQLDTALSHSDREKLLDLMWRASHPCTLASAFAPAIAPALAPALAPAIAPAPSPAPPPALAWYGLRRSSQYSGGAPAARGSGVDERWNDLQRLNHQRLNHQRLNQRLQDLQQLQQQHNAEATAQAAADAVFQLVESCL